MKNLNLLKAHYDHLLAYNKVSDSLIADYRSLIVEKDSAYNIVKQQRDLQTGRVLSANELLDRVQKTLDQADREIRKLKTQRKLLIGVVTIETIAIVLLTVFR